LVPACTKKPVFYGEIIIRIPMRTALPGNPGHLKYQVICPTVDRSKEILKKARSSRGLFIEPDARAVRNALEGKYEDEQHRDVHNGVEMGGPALLPMAKAKNMKSGKSMPESDVGLQVIDQDVLPGDRPGYVEFP
jgi:hypothetical protein